MQAVITNDIVINELVTAADIIIVAYENYKMSHIFICHSCHIIFAYIHTQTDAIK